jgi:UDP-glucuronate 4-epimerase
MKALVTGAAGFIGSHLSEALLDAGHEVVGLDCLTDYYDVELKEENAARIDLLRLDLAADPLDLAGFDCVFHLAGQPGTRSFGDVFELYVRRNVLATQRLLEAAAAAGTRVVLASSSSVYGDAERYPTPEDTELRPLSPYGITKLACERLAYAYERGLGLDVVSLRYFTVYGPRQRPDMFLARVVKALSEGGTIRIYAPGDQSRSFTYVGDAVEATIAVGERGRTGAVYNVGGGDEASMPEVIAILERISGERLAVERVEAIAGDVHRTRADVTRIADELGWTPTTPLEAGLEAQWSWASGRVGAR